MQKDPATTYAKTLYLGAHLSFFAFGGQGCFIYITDKQDILLEVKKERQCAKNTLALLIYMGQSGQSLYPINPNRKVLTMTYNKDQTMNYHSIDEHKNNSNLVSEENLTRFLSLVWQEGSVIELRCLKTRHGVISGYYDNPKKLAHDAIRLSGQVPAIYYTLNPCNATLLSQSPNRLTYGTKQTTGDTDIVKPLFAPD